MKTAVTMKRRCKDCKQVKGSGKDSTDGIVSAGQYLARKEHVDGSFEIRFYRYACNRDELFYVAEHFRAADMKRLSLRHGRWVFLRKYSTKIKQMHIFRREEFCFCRRYRHPFFSTDTGVVLRAMELNADLILAAKNIDGVYDSDPEKNPDAKKFKKISFHEVIERNLGVIDLTASALLEEHPIPMKIFSLKEKDSIINALGSNLTVRMWCRIRSEFSQNCNNSL